MADSAIDKIPAYDSRTGDHLWIISVVYRWGGPSVEVPILDAENRLMIAGPMCFYCEEVYTERLSKRRCKGEPHD